MPNLSYLEQVWSPWFEKAKVIDQHFSIRWCVNSIFPSQFIPKQIRVTNQVDILNVEVEWSGLMPNLSYLEQVWSPWFEKAKSIDHHFSIRCCVNSIFPSQFIPKQIRVTNQVDILNVEVEWSGLVPNLSYLEQVWSPWFEKAKAIDQCFSIRWCVNSIFPSQFIPKQVRVTNQVDILNVEVEWSGLIPNLSDLEQIWSPWFEKAKAIDQRFSIRWCVNSIFPSQFILKQIRVTNQFDILNVQAEWSGLMPNLSYLEQVWSPWFEKAKAIDQRFSIRWCVNSIFPSQFIPKQIRVTNQVDILNVEVEWSGLMPNLSNLEQVWSPWFEKAKAIDQCFSIRWCVNSIFPSQFIPNQIRVTNQFDILNVQAGWSGLMPNLSYLEQVWSPWFEKAKAIDQRFSIRWCVNSIFPSQFIPKQIRVTNQFDILNVEVEWSGLVPNLSYLEQVWSPWFEKAKAIDQRFSIRWCVNSIFPSQFIPKQIRVTNQLDILNVEVEWSGLVPNLSYLEQVWSPWFEKAKAIDQRFSIRWCVNSIFPSQFIPNQIRVTNQVDILNVEVEWSGLMPNLSYLEQVWSPWFEKAKAIDQRFSIQWCVNSIFPSQFIPKQIRVTNQLDILNVEVEWSGLMPNLSDLEQVWSPWFEKAKAIDQCFSIRWCVNSIFPSQFIPKQVRVTNQVDILNVEVEWSGLMPNLSYLEQVWSPWFERAKAIDQRFSIRWCVNSIFPSQFIPKQIRVTNQVDILNVEVEWSGLMPNLSYLEQVWSPWFEKAKAIDQHFSIRWCVNSIFPSQFIPKQVRVTNQVDILYVEVEWSGLVPNLSYFWSRFGLLGLKKLRRLTIALVFGGV